MTNNELHEKLEKVKDRLRELNPNFESDPDYIARMKKINEEYELMKKKQNYLFYSHIESILRMLDNF